MSGDIMSITKVHADEKLTVVNPIIPELARLAARELLLENRFYGTQEANLYYDKFLLRLAKAYGAKIIPNISDLNSIIDECMCVHRVDGADCIPAKPIITEDRGRALKSDVDSIEHSLGVPTAYSLAVFKGGEGNVMITYGYDLNLYGAQKVGSKIEYIRTDKELTIANNDAFLSLEVGEQMDLTKSQKANYIDPAERETTEEEFYRQISHNGHECEVKNIILKMLDVS